MEGGRHLNALAFGQNTWDLRQKLGINLSQLLASTEPSCTGSVVCKDDETL